MDIYDVRSQHNQVRKKTSNSKIKRHACDFLNRKKDHHRLFADPFIILYFHILRSCRPHERSTLRRKVLARWKMTCRLTVCVCVFAFLHTEMQNTMNITSKHFTGEKKNSTAECLMGKNPSTFSGHWEIWIEQWALSVSSARHKHTMRCVLGIWWKLIWLHIQK